VKRTPKQFDNIRQELNAVVAEYYNSIETSFEYSATVFGKMHPFTKFVLIPATIILVFSVLPLIPGLLTSFGPSIFPDELKLFSWNTTIPPFFYWWALLVTVTYLTYKIADKADDDFQQKRKERILPRSEMPFCFLYSATKEIKAFQVNRREVHLQHAKDMLTSYFQECEINIPPSQIKDMIAVPKKLQSTLMVSILKDSHPWFDLTHQTSTIVDAFSHFMSYLVERVSRGLELDRVLGIIEPLYLYEFARLKRETKISLISSSASISNIGREFLDLFAQQLHSLAPLPEEKPTISTKPIDSVYRKLWSKLNLLLAHKNPLTCFLTWYLILFVVFTVPVLFALTMIITLDSTILIGLLTIPFASAVAITTAVYAKRHDEK